MKRLFLFGVVLALGLGAGVRAQNAKPLPAQPPTAPKALPRRELR